jgi:hypothetical protein
MSKRLKLSSAKRNFFDLASKENAVGQGLSAQQKKRGTWEGKIWTVNR